LTIEAIKNADLHCAGWVAVCNDGDFDCVDLTIESLKYRLPMPLLGISPYSTTLNPLIEFTFENT
jgi:dethiobiotin synthetase